MARSPPAALERSTRSRRSSCSARSGTPGSPVAGIPFDDRRGLISNEGGRVTDSAGNHQIGEYVSGWIKRGPSGVIGTNKKDSQDTVDKIVEDAAADRLNEPVTDDIEAMIATHCAPRGHVGGLAGDQCDRGPRRRRGLGPQAGRGSSSPNGRHSAKRPSAR